MKVIQITFYSLFALFLLPSFSLINIGPIMLYSHHLSLIFLPFFLLLFFIEKNSIAILILSKSHAVIVLAMVFFISQALSISNAINAFAFLGDFKNITTGIIIFFLALGLIKNKHSLSLFHSIIIFTLIVWVIVHLTISHETLESAFLFKLFHPKYVDLFHAHLDNKKIFFETHFLSFLPMLYYFFFQANNKAKKVGIFFLIVTLTYLAVISNFRVTFLIFLSTLPSLFFFNISFLKKLQNILMLLLLFMAMGSVILMGMSLSKHIMSTNLIDRFSLVDESSKTSIETRFELMRSAIEVGSIYPLTGVGLGNFYEYVNHSQVLSQTPSQKMLKESSYRDPHNIFFKVYAESGLLGIVAIILLLGYFISTDGKYIIKNTNPIMRSYIFVFWSHFLYSLFNPSFALTYLAFFWMIRGIIEGMKEEKFYFLD